MANLVSYLMSQLPDRQIIDRTSLTGRFDFQLNFLPENDQAGPENKQGPESTEPGTAPYVAQAIEEQLGLKLKSTKAQIPVLIVDSVEKPSEN